MSWFAIGLLAAGAYGFKLVGFLLGERGPLARTDGDVAVLVSLVPPAMFAALAAVQTVELDGSLVFDARVVGVVVAGVASWRRAPFIVTIGLAMAATALTRLAG